MKPIITISMGDPAGIGPEVIAKAFTHPHFTENSFPLVLGDPTIMEDIVQDLGIPLTVGSFHNIDDFVPKEGQIPVLDVFRVDRQKYQRGKISATCGECAYQAVVKAVELQLEGKVSALVTAPLNKEALHLAGHYYDGHTELLGVLSKTQNYRMLLSTEKLKTIHLTSHLSLMDAIKKVTIERVLDTIRLGYEHMRQIGYVNPKIAVCGLNPHAGENGLFGKEDIEAIKPAIDLANQEGIDAEGPLPGDTTFMKAYQGSYDLIVAQYHDQGHIPSKLVAFETGVNVTVGLPIIRTSVDHGTAFDIVHQFAANASNLTCALDYALKMTEKKLSQNYQFTNLVGAVSNAALPR